MGWDEEWVPQSISSLWAYRRHPRVLSSLQWVTDAAHCTRQGHLATRPIQRHPFAVLACACTERPFSHLRLAELDFSSSHLTSFCPWCLSPQQRASYLGSGPRGRNEEQEPGELTHFGSSHCHSHLDHFDLISTHCTHLSRHPWK